MRVKILTTILVLTATRYFAQQGFPGSGLLIHIPDSSRFEAGITGNYGAYSNGFDNRFAGKLYFGGYIDPAMKANTYGFLDDENRIGVDVATGAWFRWRCKNDSSGRHFVSVRNRIHANGQYTSDAFRFVFSGNAPFKGDSINFGGTRLNYFAWKQLQYGYEWKIKKENKTEIGITGAVSLLSGSDFLTLDVNSGRLFTDSTNYNLDLKADYTLRNSDSAHTGFGAFNGWGAGIDLGINVATAPGNSPVGDQIRFSMALTDLSFIAWNSKSQSYKQDTSLLFSGYTFDLDNLKDSTFEALSFDSINPQAKHESYMNWMPWTLTLEGYSFYKLKNPINTCFTGGGVRLRQLANAHAELFFRQGFIHNEKLGITLEAGYGGYARWFLGLDVQAQFAKGWWVHAGCRQLTAYILPDQSTGQGAYLQLVKRF